MTSRVVFTPLNGGNGCSVLSAAPAPDLAAAGYSDAEFAVSGSVAGVTDSGPVDAAEFTTRVIVRRPASTDGFNGILVVEWLNVSSGTDAAPEYSYLAEELVRGGYAWAGVSAQYIGVEGGAGSVGLADDRPQSLAGKDPERYGALHHPGDAYCYDIFRSVGSALRSVHDASHPLAGLDISHVLAIGESQSAMALTTYVTAFDADEVFDGYFIHSRAAARLPLGTVGAGIDVGETFGGATVTIPDDFAKPVFTIETETDVLTNFQFHRARQDDSSRRRTWELAGTAHADLFQIGPFEDYLGSPEPVNRGQQRFALRAALAHARAWVADGVEPPTAPALELSGDGDDAAFVTDEIGNVRGGVRAPCVDAPTQVLTGVVENPVSRIHLLFGATAQIEPAVLMKRYGSVESYLDHYRAAVDEAIAEGFALEADRDELMADAHPELVSG
ncbi:hypothetical protein HH308_13005 [Gordonia sp. TBRC 11910]|uniref:Alpha/beta hydrolase domain-containing protein n=1 Tax=Gordonia asplenii TaxID=2725283 RepID=A0A848KV45_9ACTN|nr:alpha/beta hydrolase domain-containing protein [Gordonia asplenii]NMO02129.1 hypothetical protein [Gordonia asplenii]